MSSQGTQGRRGDNEKGDKPKRSDDNGVNTKDARPEGQKIPSLYIKDSNYFTPDPLGLAPRPKDKTELLADQKHPVILNIEHPSTRRPQKDAQYFKDKGAIEKPSDGPFAKTPNQRCLTCIQQGGRCHGTEVKGGRCLGCQGTSVHPGKTRRSRKCFWLEQGKGISTYADAQRINGSIQIPANQRPVVPLPTPAAAEQVNAILNAPGLLDFDTEMAEFEELTELVARLWDAGQFTTHGGANIVTIRDAARNERQQTASQLTVEQVATSFRAGYLRTIINAAESMMSRGEPEEELVPLTLLHLLPEGHPGRNYGTRAAGRGRPRDL